MANTVTIRELQNMPGFFEFDYKITKTNQRVRRKIQSGQYEVQLLKDLLFLLITLMKMRQLNLFVLILFIILIKNT